MFQREFYITAKQLRANGACPEQVKLFVRTFTEHKKVALTDENFERAVKAQLHIWWLAYRYLSWGAFCRVEAFDASPEMYEKNARRYWKAIKAKLAKDKAERPPEWY
jgi:hypothetical protein